MNRVHPTFLNKDLSGTQIEISCSETKIRYFGGVPHVQVSEKHRGLYGSTRYVKKWLPISLQNPLQLAKNGIVIKKEKK